MVKIIDTREREKEILGLIIDSYIEESKPISSAYLCQRYDLHCSAATIRNIMLSLEKQGFLSHIHTSSGKVPTKQGFKCYIENLKKGEIAIKEEPVALGFYALPAFNIEEVISHTLNSLVEFSGYTSLLAISGEDDRVFFKGMRYMLQQPEFEDIARLKDIFYTLEVRMEELGNLLFSCIGDNVRILIGDDIGFEEIADCSLLISGLENEQFKIAVGLLGPMRMNYAKASLCLNSVRDQLSEVAEELF
ncbi:MAG: hypothetical protein ABIH08_04970 [Candidatus Omnitrophota bacterium]